MTISIYIMHEFSEIRKVTQFLHYSNELDSLPEWIAGCQYLRSLFASHNNLTSLPDHLFCSELSCLQTLQLSFNKLTNLPAVIRHIPLQQLFLQSNCITTLPEHFFLASSRLVITYKLQLYNYLLFKKCLLLKYINEYQ